jgi:hypothetical protein
MLLAYDPLFQKYLSTEMSASTGTACWCRRFALLSGGRVLGAPHFLEAPQAAHAYHDAGAHGDVLLFNLGQNVDFYGPPNKEKPMEKRKQ